MIDNEKCIKGIPTLTRLLDAGHGEPGLPLVVWELQVADFEGSPLLHLIPQSGLVMLNERHARRLRDLLDEWVRSLDGVPFTGPGAAARWAAKPSVSEGRDS